MSSRKINEVPHKGKKHMFVSDFMTTHKQCNPAQHFNTFKERKRELVFYNQPSYPSDIKGIQFQHERNQGKL